MDQFSTLISESGLYESEVIEEFAKRHPKWTRLSWRERERLLLHITLCILLCNKEKIQEKETIFEKKRKIKDETDSSITIPKKPKIIDLSQPSTSKAEPSTSSGSTTGSTKSSDTVTEEDIIMEENIEEEKDNFRFHMLNYMPLKETIQNNVTKKCGLNVPTFQWDVVDLKTKTLIMIRYSSKLRDTELNYQRRASENPNNSALYFIKHGDFKGRWIGKHLKANGEEKISEFLLKRKMILEESRIPDIEDHFESEGNSIFNIDSIWVKNQLSIWKEDLLKDQFVRWKHNDLYADIEPPKTIKPSDLLLNLDHLDESIERKHPIMYKGKLLPEGININKISLMKEDWENVNLIIEYIKNILQNKSTERVMLNCKEKSHLHKFNIQTLISIWDNSQMSTFNFDSYAGEDDKKEINKVLGIKAKGKTHSEIIEKDMNQKEFKALEKRHYSLWYEEIITTLAEKDSILDLKTPFKDLLTKPPSDCHPLADLCEENCSEVLKTLLKTNAGIMCSKMTNFYSRLGGAYGQKIIETERKRGSTAIFPIISNLSDDDVLVNDDRTRLISGIVLRAPMHARNPTDKIFILTIEIMKTSERNLEFAKYINNCLLYTNYESTIIIRQNSILREDTAYNTFCLNSLFLPINLLGSITLENPFIKQDQNMKVMMSETLEQGRSWLIDRFVEGLMFSLIGNNRDEGYFALLRKMFMVLHVWRNKESCASFDIKTFCDKVNEHLIDNPISMHFHKTLIDILKIYNKLFEQK